MNMYMNMNMNNNNNNLINENKKMTLLWFILFIILLSWFYIKLN